MIERALETAQREMIRTALAAHRAAVIFEWGVVAADPIAGRETWKSSGRGFAGVVIVAMSEGLHENKHITTEAEKAELTLIDDVFGILMDYQPGYDAPLGECPLAETRGGDRTTNKGRRQ